ncbi:MAG: acyl-CoA dehydrogenase family protein [Bacteroidia bacterium]|nr:acyl-CoA dehydrogenase family protein [Bacteroidia bacterium]
MQSATVKVDLDMFREETRAWLEENCPPSQRTTPPRGLEDCYAGGRKPYFHSEEQKIWFERMRDKGWTAPTWPKAYGGGGLTPQQAKVLKEEMKNLNCRVPLWSFGLMMLGPAILHYGTEEQKQKYIREIVNGEVWWCQGYSEPGSGSDLASLQTSAEDKGDHFLVNGQKVWTSYADRSDMIFCLVRTDKDAPKHKGISFLLIDMELEGVSVRPIKLISGKSPFCETFFENVKVPKENLVGTLNEGWSIAKNLLTHERTSIGIVTEEQPLHEYAIEKLGLVDGKLNDPYNRMQIAKWSMDRDALSSSIAKTIDEAKSGTQPGAKSSFFKYYSSELNKRRYELAMSVGGTDALEWGEDYMDGKLARDMCRTKANSIEGGTSEIQLNIISKRILGLPSK